MDSVTACNIEGCETPATRTQSTLCEKHYYRIRRNGTPHSRAKRARRGTCIIDGCEQLDSGPNGLCQKHFCRKKRNGDPLTLRGPSILWGEDNPTWRGNEIKHRAAHERVKARRGKASQYACVDCGVPARHWSYDHLDPNEIHSDRPYSPDPAHYEPRCVPCHKRFDLDFIAGRVGPQ